jgi:hypothetical protein
MSKKFTKPLDNLETLSSLDFITSTTFTNLFTHQPRYLQIPTENHGRSLDYHLKAAMKVQASKNLRLFTSQPTNVQFRPNLYLTKAGQEIFPVIVDCALNPFILGNIPNIKIHPIIAVFAQTIWKHQLPHIPVNDHIQYESIIDSCLSDFKVTITTRDFQTQLKSWNTKYTSLNMHHDRFLDLIASETDLFEVHSLVIQRKKVNGMSPQFGDEYFIDQLVKDILIDKAKPIINKVWQNRKNNDVLGILSKREIDIFGTETLRLIFFVEKESSDWQDFKESSLYIDLQPYFIDNAVDRVALGTIASMNAGVSSLYQSQEQNYYDLNQLYVGERLKVLKAQLIGSDFWARIDNHNPTVSIERKLY